MRSNVPVRASIFILHYGSTESGIQWINKFLWSMEESRKALTSAIFTSTSCVCTPTPSLPIQSISRLFHLFYALHDAVLYLQPDTLFSWSRLSWWHVTLCHAKRTSGIVFCHLLATPRQVSNMAVIHHKIDSLPITNDLSICILGPRIYIYIRHRGYT